MSAFGEFTLDDVPTSIVRGKYPIVITEASGPFTSSSENNTDNNYELDEFRQFYTIKWKVDESDPKFANEQLRQVYVNVYPGLTKEKFIKASADEQSYVQNAMRFYKKFLVSVGVTEIEINSGEFEWESLKDRKIWATCYPDKESGESCVMLKSIQPRDEAKEKKIADEDFSMFTQ